MCAHRSQVLGGVCGDDSPDDAGLGAMASSRPSAGLLLVAFLCPEATLQQGQPGTGESAWKSRVWVETGPGRLATAMEAPSVGSRARSLAWVILGRVQVPGTCNKSSHVEGTR